jgi:hypothetical protein
VIGSISDHATSERMGESARIVVLQNVVRSAVVAQAVKEPKLGPSISPLQEVANRAHVSKRDQFWDQFRGVVCGSRSE